MSYPRRGELFAEHPDPRDVPCADPIRVFVGCAPGDDAESCAVLEHTLRARASEPVDVTWMHLGGGKPYDGWQSGSWGTPFTPYRWIVPELCEWRGRAIYMDSDVILRADIAELWEQDIPGVLLLRRTDGKLRTCVMLFDCAAAREHIPTIAQLKAMPDAHAAVRGYFSAHRELLAPFAGDWNCIDLKGYASIDDPRIKLIHYSSMSTQMHLPHATARLAAQGRRHWYDGATGAHWRPELIELFERELAAAKDAGFAVEHYDWPAVTYRKKSWRGRAAKVVGPDQR